MSIHQRGIGGTPSRNQAAENRANILRILRTYGPMKRASLDRLIPTINKHTMDKYLTELRKGNRLSLLKGGLWVASHPFDLRQYKPEVARRMEEHLSVLWKPGPGAGRVPNVKSDLLDTVDVKERRQKMLAVLSDTPLHRQDFIRMFPESTIANIRDDIAWLIANGKAKRIGASNFTKYVRAA